MQGKHTDEFSGKAELDRIERNLRNYNNYIVKLIISQKKWCSFPVQNILDFGAGNGSLTDLVARKYRIVPTVVELDPDLRAVLVRKQYQVHQSIDTTNSTYDFIYSSNVLEHIEDDIEVMKTLGDHLNEYGVLVLFLPANKRAWSSMDKKVGHFRRYSKRELIKKLKQAGFEIKLIKYVYTLGLILSFLYKYLPNMNGEPGAFSLLVFDRFIFPISLLIDDISGHFIGKNIFAVAQKKQQE